MGLIFDGVDLEERFGVMVDGAGTWAVPRRDQELIHVPGRNGDLILDHGCWQNVNITYRFLIKDNWIWKFDDFSQWLMEHRGYYELEDPERHPGVYRMAAIVDEVKPTLWFRHKTGICEITFSCKPENYSYEGNRVEFQFLTPETAGGEMKTGYIRKNGNDIKVTPEFHSAVSDTVYGTFYVYDSSKTQIAASTSEAITDGTPLTYTISASGAYYWRFVVSNIQTDTTYDKLNFRVESDTLIDGEAKTLDAIFARQTGKFENPTGYIARPIINYYGNTGYSVKITNYNQNGTVKDYWFWNINNFSTKSTQATMDCDMQSIFYDYTDNNGFPRSGSLGSFLVLSDSGSRVPGKALSFPAFTGDTFDFYLYGLGGSLAPLVPGLIEIIPRWVTI